MNVRADIRRYDKDPSYLQFPEITHEYPGVFRDPNYLLITAGTVKDILSKRSPVRPDLDIRINEFCDGRPYELPYFVNKLFVSSAKNGRFLVHATPIDSSLNRVQGEMDSLSAVLGVKSHKHNHITIGRFLAEITATNFADTLTGFNLANKDEPLFTFGRIIRK